MLVPLAELSMFIYINCIDKGWWIGEGEKWLISGEYTFLSKICCLEVSSYHQNDPYTSHTSVSGHLDTNMKGDRKR